MNIYEESLNFHAELNADNIILKAFDLKVQRMVAEAVKEAAIKSGANK